MEGKNKTKQKTILVFPKREWVTRLAGFPNPAVMWCCHNRFCPLSYESRWTVFTGNNLLLYMLENILPEWVRLICWTQTWPALLPLVFFLFLGEIGDATLEGSQSGTFKITSTEKEWRTKIKNSPTHQQDTKGAWMFPFYINKNLYKLCFLGRHSEWKESYSGIVHPCP